LPEPQSLRVENKMFYFDIGHNRRGTFMRISEVCVLNISQHVIKVMSIVCVGVSSPSSGGRLTVALQPCVPCLYHLQSTYAAVTFCRCAI